ncbi:ABC transporter ATP-binding protein [Pseudobacteroides cellulosolvens]|uniref:Xenobiotic-transporting ATPase n=1 Tax=Pseudobacteroides cellulosolvens ATCC 35603 = DSM 2933 TaxID=398512 RepID=A0A0L6JSE1_9FIRM|nr:ABC transporter ATP-binding protein [Pseudobacteroides cellulosolvens]KNY28703.1 Xenobiotic-transporting ATPase [Pseudobacteroides cellulosolvens ATCC 35603 = DSM 2933]
MNELRYIKDVILKCKYKYIAGIICIFMVDILQMVLPKVLGVLTDKLKSGNFTKDDLVTYSILIVVVSISTAVFRFSWRYLVFGVSKLIEKTIRERLYIQYQRLSPNYYNVHKTGDLMSHATNDIDNIRMMVGQGVALISDSLLLPAAILVMLILTAGVKMTLAAFSPMIFLIIVVVSNVKNMHIRINRMQEAISDLTEKTRENISGIRVVKSFVQESEEVEKFKKSNLHNKEMNLKFVRIMSTLHPFVMAISYLTFAITLLYGGLKVIYSEITIGEFVTFAGYLLQLIWPIAALGWVTSIFQKGIVSLKRVNILMDENPDIVDSDDSISIDSLDWKIEMKHLNFTYPESHTPSLENINISLKKGKTLAICGKTGSGKTTLINLIPRLFNASAGTLFIDDVDINRISLSSLRKNIGYVPQDTILFSATIKENICFFRDFDDESIIKAAKAAGIHNDIIDFPRQYETIVGERGVNLSGGQKQRISIARAIIGNPSLLVLDDCLSAVDTHTEALILGALKEIMKERTSIIVSHRISAIKDADEIIMLDEGRIIERGNHDSLLEQKGIYCELYQKQLLAAKIEEEE